MSARNNGGASGTQGPRPMQFFRLFEDDLSQNRGSSRVSGPARYFLVPSATSNERSQVSPVSTVSLHPSRIVEPFSWSSARRQRFTPPQRPAGTLFLPHRCVVKGPKTSYRLLELMILKPRENYIPSRCLNCLTKVLNAIVRSDEYLRMEQELFRILRSFDFYQYMVR